MTCYIAGAGSWYGKDFSPQPDDLVIAADGGYLHLKERGIRVDLLIESQQDAQDFSQRLLACRDNPLKVLTDDFHYHTIAAPSEKLLDLIGRELAQKGFLA